MLRGTQTDSKCSACTTTLLTLVSALVVNKINYCVVCRYVWTTSAQASVSPLCRCSTRLFGKEIGSHIPAAPYAALAAGFEADPVPARPMQFALYRCLHGTVPTYLADSLRRTADVDGRRRLRSSVSDTLVVAPTNRSTLGDRAFPVAASRAWNGLPSSVRATLSLSTFRQELRGHFSSSRVFSDLYLSRSLIILTLYLAHLLHFCRQCKVPLQSFVRDSVTIIV